MSAQSEFKSPQSPAPIQQDMFSLANYFPHLLGVSRCGDDLRPAHLIVDFELVLSDGTRVPCKPEPLDQLCQQDFTQLDYRCCNFSQDAAEIRNWLNRTIREQVGKLRPEQSPYFPTSGWHEFNGKHVYLAGNRLIGPNGFLPVDAYTVSAKFQQLEFIIDETLPEKDLLLHLRQLVFSAGPVSASLVAYMLFSLLEPLLLKAGWERRFVCYLAGPSQTKKTTLAQWASSIYNRDTAIFQPESLSLLSTESAIFDNLNGYAHCTRLVDDLYAGSSRSAKRERDEKVSRIIRLVGNGAVRRRGRTGDLDAINCGIICTGEYLPEGFSTLTRCLILQLEQPIPSDKMANIQRRPLAWPTLLYRFLSWVASCYDTLVFFFHEAFAQFQRLRSQTPVMEERLQEFQWALDMSIETLGLFLNSTFPNDKSDARYLIQNAKKLVSQAISCQKELLAQERERSNLNRFSTCLAELYFCSHAICITEKPKKRFLAGSAAVKYKGCLCMKSDYLLTLMQEHFGDPSITVQKITAELRANHLLEMDKSAKSSKKLGTVRALFVRIEDLRAYLNYSTEPVFTGTLYEVDAAAATMGLPVPGNPPKSF